MLVGCLTVDPKPIGTPTMSESHLPEMIRVMLDISLKKLPEKTYNGIDDIIEVLGDQNFK